MHSRLRIQIAFVVLSTTWTTLQAVAQTESTADGVNRSGNLSTEAGGAQSSPGTVADIFAERHVGRVGDVELDIDTSVPRPDAVFPNLFPKRLTECKQRIAEQYGLKLAVSYQQLYQHAAETVPGGRDTAWGEWLQIDAELDLLNPGGDYHGSLIASLDWRQSIGGNTAPAFFNFDTGSLWQTHPAHLEWSAIITELFWQQWLGRDRFAIRIGQQASGAVLDFFRFGDLRTSFTTSHLTFPTAIDPVGPGAFGVSFKWWPVDDSELYIVGTLTDINGPQPAEGRLDWSGLFKEGEVYTGFELGNNWRRSSTDFDHAHITFWYADESSRRPFPTDDGFGVKVHGEKQFDRTVIFANYGYNTSRGGGFGMTNSRHAINAGAALLKPCGITGEMAVAFSWGQPLGAPDPLRGVQSDRDQYGAEVYWKILLTPELFVTPGLQLIGNPSFNAGSDLIAIPQVKFRAFF